jgi:hypothetical protein
MEERMSDEPYLAYWNERAEQQRWPPVARHDIPQPHRPDEVAAVARHEGESCRMPPAFAQPMRDLAEAGAAVAGIEQRLARRGVFTEFSADCDHGHPLCRATG